MAVALATTQAHKLVLHAKHNCVNKSMHFLLVSTFDGSSRVFTKGKTIANRTVLVSWAHVAVPTHQGTSKFDYDIPCNRERWWVASSSVHSSLGSIVFDRMRCALSSLNSAVGILKCSCSLANSVIPVACVNMRSGCVTCVCIWTGVRRHPFTAFSVYTTFWLAIHLDHSFLCSTPPAIQAHSLVYRWSSIESFVGLLELDCVGGTFWLKCVY